MENKITRKQVIKYIKKKGLEWEDLREIDFTDTDFFASDFSGASLDWVNITGTSFEYNYIIKDGKKVMVEVIIKEID